MQRPITWAVFALFTAFSVWVVVTEGYLGFLELAVRDPWSTQVFVDLCISLALVLRWLIPDARKRNMSPWPWVVGTLLLGSISPLLYAALRPKS